MSGGDIPANKSSHPVIALHAALNSGVEILQDWCYIFYFLMGLLRMATFILVVPRMGSVFPFLVVTHNPYISVSLFLRWDVVTGVLLCLLLLLHCVRSPIHVYRC